MLCSSDWEAVVKLSDDFNGADLRNVCTEAGTLLLYLQIIYIYIESSYPLKYKTNIKISVMKYLVMNMILYTVCKKT